MEPPLHQPMPPPWKQGDELLFSKKDGNVYDAQEFHYTCVTDGVLECASSLEFIEDRERKRIWNQLGRK